MIYKDFAGYKEMSDVSKISPQNLVYPSKNVFVNYGKITTRGGLENDGVEATVQEAIHSEFVWKDALGGIRPVRVHGNTVQVKYDSKWYTIFTGIDSSTVRVFFATWIDNNTTIIKKRLVFVDGSTSIYTWNGAIGEVASATTNTAVLTSDNGTCLQQGFDAGDVTAQTILHFIGSATTANSEESQTNDPTAQTLSISGTFDTTPVEGDIIIAKPVAFADMIASTFDLDFIYSYKNHIIVGNYNSVNLYFSHIETYSLATGFDFAMPSAESRTALTPILMRLDANPTAIISKKDTLWISDADDWYKVVKTVEQNAYGLWVDVEKVEVGENKGALPMAVAKHKGDIVYLSQDYGLQRVITNEVLGTDEIKLESDEVQLMFDRIDLTDVRLYYLQRAIYIVCPVAGALLMFDTVEGHFQPPQYMPLNCISVISGVKYGHHNVQNETFEMFKGRNDLGSPIEAVISFGYSHGGIDKSHEFRQKRHSMFGFSGRLTVNTKIGLEQQFEEEGGRHKIEEEFKGDEMVTYSLDDDVSWATNPYATRSWGGEDMVVTDLKRVLGYTRLQATDWFDFRPVFTINPLNNEDSENEFHLLAWYIDEEISPNTIPDNLFLAK